MIGLMAAGLLPGPMAGAADLDKAAPSLQWIPQDAAFYSVMLRNKEQIDVILKSKAWARLSELPAVQLAWKTIHEQLAQAEAPWAQIHQFIQQPENRQLIEMLGDMMSEEIFTYGGHSCAELVALLAELQGGMRFQQIALQLQQVGPADQPKMYAQALLNLLADKPERLKAPDFIIGFRLSDTARAEAQLKRLETLATQLIARVPQLEGRFKRAAIGQDSFLTLTLDGKMIPWDLIPIKDVEDKPGQYKDLIQKLTQLKITISLGVRGQYLLLAIGETTGLVARLSQEKTERLADRPEFKPLARFVDRRLTTISYASKDFRSKIGMSAADLSDLGKTAKDLLPYIEFPEKEQAQLKRDIDQLGEDLKRFIPRPGATLSFAYLTEHGPEGYDYDYDWSEQLQADGSKPLPLLDHVGGNPILAMVGRSKFAPEDYHLVVKWIKTFNHYAEVYIQTKLDDTQKEQYQKFARAIHPLLRRLDEVTGKLLLPALADGQAALAVDAKLTSRQWLKLLPPTEKALPILEPAIVVGVSDAAKLSQAFSDYRSIANDLLREIRQLAGEEFPDFQIPAPQKRTLKVGELYFFTLPPNIPLDERLLPTAGLSANVATLTLSHEHAERLLTATPLAAAGPLANTRRPLAMATFFNWAGLIDAVTPWIEMGVQIGGPFLGDTLGEAGGKSSNDLLSQVQTVLSIMKVFRNYSSATYFENGAMVTHSATALKDL
jgi:hypothetical protein